MKILMTCLLDWSRPSAGRIHFGSLARAFRDAGHELVGLIPGHEGGDPFSRMSTVTVPGKSLAGQARLSLSHLRKLILLLREEKPDALYFRFRSCSPAVVRTARIVAPKTRIITEFNNLPSELLLMSGYNRQIAGLAKYSHLKSARYSHLVRTLSDTHREVLISHGIDKNRIVVAGTGADLDHFHPMNRDEALGVMGLNPSFRYITFAGFLTRWQGVDTLIRAAPLIAHHHPDVRFIIAGSGPQSEKLKQLAIENKIDRQIIFTGELDYKKIPALINCSDICIGPLITECSGQMTRSPMKLREYAACGKPAITVCVDGVQELASAGAVFLAQSGDPKDFAKLANHLLDHSDVIHQAGQLAHEYARIHYSWNTIARHILLRMEEIAT